MNVVISRPIMVVITTVQVLLTLLPTSPGPPSRGVSSSVPEFSRNPGGAAEPRELTGRLASGGPGEQEPQRAPEAL